GGSPIAMGAYTAEVSLTAAAVACDRVEGSELRRFLLDESERRALRSASLGPLECASEMLVPVEELVLVEELVFTDSTRPGQAPARNADHLRPIQPTVLSADSVGSSRAARPAVR